MKKISLVAPIAALIMTLTFAGCDKPEEATYLPDPTITGVGLSKKDGGYIEVTVNFEPYGSYKKGYTDDYLSASVGIFNDDENIGWIHVSGDAPSGVAIGYSSGYMTTEQVNKVAKNSVYEVTVRAIFQSTDENHVPKDVEVEKKFVSVICE